MTNNYSSFRYATLASILSVIVLFTAACDNDNPTQLEKQEKNTLFKQTHTLKDRIQTFSDSKKKTNLFKPEPGISKRFSKNGSADNLEIKPVAQVTSPKPGSYDKPLAASHLYWDQSNDNVYIAYITPGKKVGGGFDMLDDDMNCYTNNSSGSDCRDASFTSNILDVGAVTTGNGHFYATGNVDTMGGNSVNGIDTGEYDSPAAIFRTPIDNFAVGQIKNTDLAAQSATDVKMLDGDVFATSGAGTGKFYKLDEDLDEMASSKPSNSDLRSIAYSSDTFYLLNGDGQLYSTSRNSLDLSLSELGTSLSDSIRTATIAKISYDDGKLYVPFNNGGFAAVDADDGSIIDQRSDVYYSSLTVNDDYIYAAGANDGGVINVFKWNSDGDELNHIGHAELPDFQANLIASFNGYLFVANGQDGTSILKVEEK